MTKQHDHAHFSGQVARGFTESLFVDRKYVQDVVLAIQEHDRAWIRLDDTPIWNDRNAVPFSFVDYPLLPKLALYRLGLDEVEGMNEYAALLCSLHYSSFHHIRNSDLSDCVAFVNHETERQNQLKAGLGVLPDGILSTHLRLLKLCDKISLYVCLNEPGVSKDREHPWYKEGVGIAMGEQHVTANWLSSNEILIRPRLFEKETRATLKFKQVSKDLIKRVGIEEAYKQTNWKEMDVVFRNEAEISRK